MSLSPMMKQYFEIKDNYDDCLLFFRLGDFYEMFFEDAKIASKVLDLTLTGRDCGMSEKAPMCGVPFHAVDNYIAKLIEKGYKVAICEQLSLPEKGIAARDVIRVITPGTVMESNMLADDANNYLVCLFMRGSLVGVCWADISTGEFNRAYIDAQPALKLNDLLVRINPAEIICNSEMMDFSSNLSVVKYNNVVKFSKFDDLEFDITKAKEIIPKMCKDYVNILKEEEPCIIAAGALLRYVSQTQKRDLNYIRQYDDDSEQMMIDSCASKTLELLQTVTGKKFGSLLWALNKTQTSMGARLLTRWISAPLINEVKINERLNAVEELYNKGIYRANLRRDLNLINDIERISARIAYGNISPKECLALANSLGTLPEIKEICSNFSSGLLKKLCLSLNTLEDVTKKIKTTIKDEPSTFIRDGGVIKDGFNVQLDEYRNVSKGAKTILAEIEANEKQKTGIKTLRIGFNKIFGYYIEVSKGQIGMVPYDYIRKQTLANCERYITEDLKIIEDKILHAEEHALALEIRLYGEFISELTKYCEDIIFAAKIIAQIDVLASNAEISCIYKYKKPLIGNDITTTKIKEGRHIIVERSCDEGFVPNDTYLNDSDSRVLIITGPNMAGKSVYMRQVALIVILAHIGFFVPAESAEISITDHVFTRVGANDDLHSGRSTFMVEMSEVSNIIKNATDRSLILLDELGRGTSTYDGLSIAQAVVEYISSNFKAKTLFSTHYHELIDLEEAIFGLKNYKMTVREVGGNIVFLRKLLRGGASKSFGIEVAGISGLPQVVIARSKEILKQLEKLNITRQNSNPSQQISIFNTSKSGEILKYLRELRPDDISPREAFDILEDLHAKALED